MKKYIKIFLASSIVDFAHERQELGNFIRHLNDLYVERDIYFKLTICEDLSNAIARERKQEEYNQFIRDSQFFYILFGKRAGDYTIEEFDVALEQFRASGAPKIYTYFKQLPDGEQPEESVLRFMERLGTQIDHYYSQFSHLDSIKLNLMLELTQDPSLHSTVKFEDGQAVLDDKELLPLENIPIYSKNETVQQLLAEKNRMVEELSAIVAEYNQNSEDTGLFNDMTQIVEQIRHLNNQLHQMEKAVLELHKQTQNQSKQQSWRKHKASELLNVGDYEGAKNILRDKQWGDEVLQTEDTPERKKEMIQEYISGQRLLISILTAMGDDTETVQEITDRYEKLVLLAEQYEAEMNVLYDYATFLNVQCMYPEGIAVAKHLREYYEHRTETPPEDKALLLNILGVLHTGNQDFTQAEAAYRMTLEIYRQLVKSNPEEYEPDLTSSYNNLAWLLHNINKNAEAEELFREALEILRRLAKNNPAAYEPKLASTCNNLAILLDHINHKEESEKLHREALEMKRRLVKGNPAAYEPDLATSCNNLAWLLHNINKNAEAEKLFREALEILRRLAKNNPAAYEPRLAASCSNLALVLMDIDKKEEAEKLHREALEMKRRFAKSNPAAYEQHLPPTCRNLALLLDSINLKEEAGDLYCEALEIQRRLAKSTPAAYEPDLASICIDYANFLMNLKQNGEAKNFLREAGKLYLRLSKNNPAKYEPKLAFSYASLGVLMSRSKHNQKEAKEYLSKALEIYEKYPHLSDESQEVRDFMHQISKR